jgi:hypothetical protein
MKPKSEEAEEAEEDVKIQGHGAESEQLGQWRICVADLGARE